jgi:hypothetical protein
VRTIVTVYGLPDATMYEDVATASVKAADLGATVVSQPDMPQIRAVFGDPVEACSFVIWLSTRKVTFHTFQLTQTAEDYATPWPDQAAERVKAGCAALARFYNTYANRHRMNRVQPDAANLIAEAIERTPLMTLSQEGYSP